MNRIIETVNNTVASNPVLLDVQAGLTQAKNEVMTQAKFAINSIVIPIICVVLAGVLIFLIAGAVSSHRKGEDYGDKIKPIVIIFFVIVLIASAPLWVWTLVGV